MDITIQRRRFTFRSEYDIIGPDFHYSLRKRLFSLLTGMRLKSSDGRELATLRARPSLFRSKFEFRLCGGRIYQFRCEKRWKGVFLCQGEKGFFRCYQHKGRNCSIFDKDRQIAAFTRNLVNLGNGECYHLRVDRDADPIVLICIVLAVGRVYERNDANVTFDLGNIGPEARPFDESWEPN